MVELSLPRLVGSRAAAWQLLEPHLQHLENGSVVLNCRDLRSGSPSFADEVVKLVLADGGAHELVLVGASDDFARYVQESAAARSVQGRVALLPAGAEIGA